MEQPDCLEVPSLLFFSLIVMLGLEEDGFGGVGGEMEDEGGGIEGLAFRNAGEEVEGIGVAKVGPLNGVLNGGRAEIDGEKLDLAHRGELMDEDEDARGRGGHVDQLGKGDVRISPGGENPLEAGGERIDVLELDGHARVERRLIAAEEIVGFGLVGENAEEI